MMYTTEKKRAGKLPASRFHFLKIDRAETQFDSSVDTYAPEVYAKAKELLENAIADGTFIKDSEQAYYIYELTMDGRVQTGLVACASIDDYESNVIKNMKIQELIRN